MEKSSKIISLGATLIRVTRVLMLWFPVTFFTTTFNLESFASKVMAVIIAVYVPRIAFRKLIWDFENTFSSLKFQTLTSYFCNLESCMTAFICEKCCYLILLTKFNKDLTFLWELDFKYETKVSITQWEMLIHIHVCDSSILRYKKVKAYSLLIWLESK